MGAAENTRRIHAAVVVGLCATSKSTPKLGPAIESTLDEYCTAIKDGSNELSDEEVEQLRFVTAIRTELDPTKQNE